MIKLFIGAVAAAIIIIVSFTFITPMINGNSSDSGSSSDSDSTSLSVAIEGEVKKTGNYVLSEGATMASLISASGGLTTNADERTFYESSLLTSGTTYYIGSLFDSSDICASDQIEKVNVNTADASTLMSISGFTSSISESLVSYRNSNGEFQTIEGILDVYGIGNATYRKVRSYIYLHE